MEVRQMKKLLSCAFNMDNGCVELKFNDGSMIAINCTAAENEVYSACRIIADKLLLLIAVDVMAAEVARSGVPQTACHSHASVLAQLGQYGNAP